MPRARSICRASLPLLPASLVPVEAERAQLRYRIAGGAGNVEGELGRLRVTLAKGVLVVDGGKLTASAKPDKGATIVHASLPLASLALPGVAAEKLVVTADARIAADGLIGGDANVRFGGVRASGPTRVALRDGDVSAHVEELHVDAAVPLQTRGKVTVNARAGNVDVVHAALHAVADGADTTVRAHLRGEPPYAVDVEEKLARLRVTSAGRALLDAATTLSLHASDVRPDATRPRRTRGKLHADAAVGPLTLAIDADKAPDAVDYKVRADASTLAQLKALVPRGAVWHAPWDCMSLALASDGRVEHLAAPFLREHTTVALGHAALESANGKVAADRLELDSTSQGTSGKHELTAELRTRALAVDGAAQGDTAMTARAGFDSRASSAHVKIATTGDKGPLVAVDATLGFDRARRAVTYDFDAKVARLVVAGAAGARRRGRLRLRHARGRDGRQGLARRPGPRRRRARRRALRRRAVAHARGRRHARSRRRWARLVARRLRGRRAARALARYARHLGRPPPGAGHAHRRRARARLRRSLDRLARRARRD